MIEHLPLHPGSTVVPGETYTILLPYVPDYEIGQEVELTDGYSTRVAEISVIGRATIVKVREVHMSELGNPDLEREVHPHMRSWPNANEYLASREGFGSGLCSHITFTVHED
jgi:hypothetical protein